jgi:hypothetical protein
MSLDSSGNLLLTGTSTTVRVATNGGLAWSAPYGGRAVVTDTNGNVYVTGFSDLDYATAKLDPNGTNLWTRTFTYLTTTNLPDISNLISLGPNGSVIISGVETTSSLHGYNTLQIRTIAYDANGSQLWAEDSATAGPANSQVVSATALTLGNLGREAVMGNYPGIDNFAVKVFDVSGGVLWTWYLDADGTYAYDGTGTSSAWAGDGSLILAGSQVTGYPDYRGVLVKLGTNGHKVWISGYQGPSAGLNQFNAVAVDADGGCYATGFSPGNGTGNDIVTIKFDSNGNQLWVQRYNGPANGDDIGTGIVLDGKGGVYVCGYSATTSGGTEFVTIKYLDRPSVGQPQKRSDGNFQFQLNSWVGTTNTVESSSNLTTWSALTSVVVTNMPMPFVDLGASNFPTRFYRVRIP